MKLMVTVALLYWFSIRIGAPESVSQFLGLAGSLAGTLFLRGLFRAHPVGKAHKLFAYLLLVCTYPLAMLVPAVALKPTVEHVVPEFVTVMAAVLVVIYPVAQIAFAITYRHLTQRADCKLADFRHS